MLILGALAIIVGCGSLGLWLAKRIRCRPQEIRACITALSLLDTEIFWGSTPLPEACLILTERMEEPWKAFFLELHGRLAGGEAAGRAWDETADKLGSRFCLKAEDWAIVRDVGKGLGRSDRHEQHKQLERVQKQLSDLKEQVGEWADKQAKMWSYLGFLVGIAGVIFLI